MTTKLLTFYQYYTPTGVKFYYEPTSKQRTYQFPENSVVIDSKTKQLIYAPPGVKVKLTDQSEITTQNSVNNIAQSPPTNISQNPPLLNNPATISKLSPKSLQPNYQPMVTPLNGFNPPSPTVKTNSPGIVQSSQFQSQSQIKTAVQLQSQLKPQPIQQQVQNPHFIQIPPTLQAPAQVQIPQIQTTNPQTQIPQIQPPKIQTTIPQIQPLQDTTQNPQNPPQNPQIPTQNQQIPKPFLQTQVPQTAPINPQMQTTNQPMQAENPLVQNQTSNQIQNTYKIQPQQIQQQTFPKQFPQITTQKSSDLQNYSRFTPPGQNARTMIQSSLSDFTQNPNLPNNQNSNMQQQNQISNMQQQNQISILTSINRVPSSVRPTDSIPLMPDYLVPTQVVHNFSPWTINIIDSPKVDFQAFTFPHISLSKEASSFQSDNPFNYPERIQLSFTSSGSGFSSPFLDDPSGCNADDESSSGRPSSLRLTSSMLNDTEIKTPFFIIELIANTFKVNADSIKTKSGFLELLDKYQLTELAVENFRKPSNASSTKKGSSSYEEELVFSDKPLQKPLLKKVKNNLKPLSTTISTSILQFIGVIQGYNQIIVAHTLCQLIQPHQELIDETFFQIIKQATNNPNPRWAENCYLLFLIMCCLFKPRKSNRLYIVSWAARHLLQQNFKIREFFGYSIIRFESRFLRGTYKDEITIDLIKNIPSQIERLNTLFECSIFELMWSQRKRFPHLPIPLPFALIVKELTKKKAVKTPNLLDLPYDQEKVEQLSVDMLSDPKILDRVAVEDLMGLLKYWLISISDPLISRSTFNAFLHYENPIEYVNGMPSAHRDSLKYLVGFLQDILNNDDENNSTGSKLASVFGPLIVDPTEIVHTQEVYDAIIARSSEFLKSILFAWQTGDIYPLPSEFTETKKDKTGKSTVPQNRRNSVCPLKTAQQVNSPPISH